MTIRTNSFVFLAFAAITWICSFHAIAQADDAAFGPIASDHGQGYVVHDVGYGNIFTDNIFTRAYHSISRDFKRNNCWPRPFVWKDREASRAPFVVMANKGWQLENTLGEYHFDRDTGKINEPGRRRVYWIVTQELPRRRAIFVHRAMRPVETEARLDSVQQWVARIVPKGNMPPVLETNRPAPGRGAEEVDKIRVDYLKSMPAPRLPANESMDTGSSGM